VTDDAVIRAADHAARHWHSAAPGPLRPGSDAHRLAICQMFAETFNPYKPAVIEWPHLDAEALARLTSLPIWDIAVQTEGKASRRMLAFADALADREMSDAIRLNGWEEQRHREVLSHLVAAYGIKLAPEPEYPVPRDAEWAYLVTGFSECVDSFMAFGLFAMAERSGFFPPELVETFEPVIQEECRHILLFANWLAWHRARLPLWRRPWFELRVWAAWLLLGWDRIGIARGMDAKPQKDNQDYAFTVAGAKAVSAEPLSMGSLLTLCLAENDRRFGGYDPRLVRPTTTPALARFALRIMRWFSFHRGTRV
jgi:hypothetical protein